MLTHRRWPNIKAKLRQDALFAGYKHWSTRWRSDAGLMLKPEHQTNIGSSSHVYWGSQRHLSVSAVSEWRVEGGGKRAKSHARSSHHNALCRMSCEQCVTITVINWSTYLPADDTPQSHAVASSSPTPAGVTPISITGSNQFTWLRETEVRAIRIRIKFGMLAFLTRQSRATSWREEACDLSVVRQGVTINFEWVEGSREWFRWDLDAGWPRVARWWRRHWSCVTAVCDVGLSSPGTSRQKW